MANSLLIAVHAFTSRVLMSFSVNETLLPRQVNLSTSFREPPFSVEMLVSLIKAHIFCFVSVQLLPVPDYAVGIWIRWVYLPKSLSSL